MLRSEYQEIFHILLMTLAAGLMISLGGGLAYWERVKNSSRLPVVKHFIIALGGGLLLSAVCLVLIPQGLENASLLNITLSLLSGGVVFFLIDRFLEKRGGPVSQLLATLLDFIPESMALGASYVRSPKIALFLAIIIGLQNLPEGFNAFEELSSSQQKYSSRYLLLFIALSLFGPLSGALGYFFLSSHPWLLSSTMLFSSAGILYLTFQEIAPESKLARSWRPALGAVIGFFLGILSQYLVNLH